MTNPTGLCDNSLGKVITNRDQVGGLRRLTDGVSGARAKVQLKNNMPVGSDSAPGFGPKTINTVSDKLSSPKRENIKFGCELKSKLKPGFVRHIVQELDGNIRYVNSNDNTDIENSTGRIVREQQCHLLTKLLDSDTAKPAAVSITGVDSRLNNCQTETKVNTFEFVNTEGLSEQFTTIPAKNCHTQSQLTLSRKDVMACQAKPQPNTVDKFKKEILIKTINKKLSPKNLTVRTQTKFDTRPKSIKEILKPSPKSSSIKKIDKNKVQKLIRDFEGTNTAKQNSPLGKALSNRAGGKRAKKKFEVPPDQPKIRAFMERSNCVDRMPKEGSRN